MRIAGIVVYNPEMERLKSNIDAIYPQVDLLIIYLNSNFNRELTSDYAHVQYIGNGNNDGVAKALNCIMSVADEKGAAWCLLLDQDSIVADDCIEKFERYIDIENTAVLSPNISDDRDTEIIASYADAYTEIDMCITSGSYNNVGVWKEVKGFREEFLIDYVDWEYCARVRSRGYRIYRINELNINHQLGAKTYHRIMGRKVFTYNHNAFRKYYITRNTIVSYLLFPAEDKFAHPYLRTWKRLLYALMFEKGKGKKTVAILRGLIDSSKLYRELKGKQENGY